VPGFQLDSEGSHAFAPALVDLSCGVVEDLEHGDDACRVAPGALDEGSLGTDVADRESDAARVLADDSTLLEGLVDSLDAVLLYGQQEAGGHLCTWGTCVEHGGRGVRELFVAHQVLGAESFGQVAPVDAQGHPHVHVLRTFNGLVRERMQEVTFVEGLDREEVLEHVPAEVELGLDLLVVGLH